MAWKNPGTRDRGRRKLEDSNICFNLEEKKSTREDLGKGKRSLLWESGRQAAIGVEEIAYSRSPLSRSIQGDGTRTDPWLKLGNNNQQAAGSETVFPSHQLVQNLEIHLDKCISKDHKQDFNNSPLQSPCGIHQRTGVRIGEINPARGGTTSLFCYPCWTNKR